PAGGAARAPAPPRPPAVAPPRGAGGRRDGTRAGAARARGGGGTGRGGGGGGRGQTVWRSVGRLASALRSAGPPVRLTALLLLSACQPEARRLLLLDLALSDPVLLNGTARPWRDQGYTVEYRRFYPHIARADLARYRVPLFLLGRAPEAPSDALTVGDLALLTEWVLRGGVVVLGYDADGEGYLDRWTANRWLESVGTGISIGDRLLEATTA